MLIERIANRLELSQSGRAPIAWSEPERERRIVLDIADLVESVVACEPTAVAEALHELSFWIWSLCRHGHWREDSTLELYLEMLSMETRELGICTGLLSIGVELGGAWPAPWPETLDDNDEARLLDLLGRDRARLEKLARSVRETSDCVTRLRGVAARLRRAVDGIAP